MTNAAMELREENASMPELLLGMWLNYLETEDRGTWYINDHYREFVLNEDVTVVFLLGRTAENRLFLGVGPEVGDWFLDLDWRCVLNKNGALRLCLRYEEDDVFLVIPVQPLIHRQLPNRNGVIELSALEVETENGQVVNYDRVRTRELPYHYCGE